jgi:hypothetical protein
MNSPGSFVHWSIFDISVANLVLIAVMVSDFRPRAAAAVPAGHRVAPDIVAPDLVPGPAANGADLATAAGGEPVDAATARMWTYRVRRRAVRALQPRKVTLDGRRTAVHHLR